MFYALDTAKFDLKLQTEIYSKCPVISVHLK